MVDFLSPSDRSDRSERMSRIRGRDTQPELALRKALHRMGFRYRLHEKKLPGKPDIVLPRYKVVVFVHGWAESIIKCNTQPVRYRDGQALRTTHG